MGNTETKTSNSERHGFHQNGTILLTQQNGTILLTQQETLYTSQLKRIFIKTMDFLIYRPTKYYDFYSS